ncbi:hypothetical protein T36_2298 (plasmid) [Helicobacter cinaedi]|uniref:hypothetical protein n=1 Tax=Helicobacter cinaedi TaxID=213 RepID=UPI001F422710|nr:hypothetical protein [Helicobacter cinaedi]BDB65819.1 hypothetical protein T36_2298 [Helicobacter cinaedi]
MPRAKKRPTYIKSLRVDSETKQFLESLENANEFVLQLLQNTDDYQKFIKALREKENQNQPKLF